MTTLLLLASVAKSQRLVNGSSAGSGDLWLGLYHNHQSVIGASCGDGDGTFRHSAFTWKSGLNIKVMLY
jgi:hypothetical protein